MTNWVRNGLRACAFFVTATAMTGCMVPLPVGMISESEPLSPQSYMPIDFKKWNSGMFADEFVGKPVLVDGYFQKSPMAASLQGSDISFNVFEKSMAQMQHAERRIAGGSGESLIDMFRPIMVTAPLAMREIIYPIQDYQRVRVYGVAVNPYGRSVFTRQITMSTLMVRAHKVEVVR